MPGGGNPSSTPPGAGSQIYLLIFKKECHEYKVHCCYGGGPEFIHLSVGPKKVV